MLQEVEVKTGGVPVSAYNVAAAIAAQNVLNTGKPMEEAVRAAHIAKKEDERNAPKPAANPEVLPNTKKWRDYCLCLAHVLHGKFAHLPMERLEQIARLHSGHGIRSFADWSMDDE